MYNSLFDIGIKDKKGEGDNKYSKKINIPQYLPKEKQPNIEELYNIKKYSTFIRNINNSNVSEEEKKFLKFAATRHIVFNYSKVADYYAHADKEMQKLMEQSALVIIDVDDAIANGYMKLSKNIRNMIKDSEVEIDE